MKTPQVTTNKLWRTVVSVSMATMLLATMAPIAMASVASSDQASASAEVALAGDDEGNISSSSQHVTVAAARPWTEEEMKAAKPYPVPTRKASARSTRPAAVSAAARSTRGKLDPGGLPSGKTLSVSGTSEDGINLLAGRQLLGYSYPPPFTRHEAGYPYSSSSGYTTWPLVTIGKLFFTQRGTNYVCSAASIGNKGIWTAGHCVHDGSNSSAGWSTNVVFVPAYRNGASPRGQWTAYSLSTKTAWYQNGDLEYDMGGAKLNLRNGQTISQAVGWLGFAWNWGYQQHWDLFGYPAASPFNGELMQQCESSFAYQDSPSSSGLPTQGVGCDQTGGTSGGPWVLQLGSGNYLNGNNSYRRIINGTVQSQELFSPHLTDSAKSLKDLLTAS